MSDQVLEGGYYFDQAAADRAIAFFPEVLVHVKGRWAGQPFELLPWEQEVIGQIFGWKREDGTRRYRVAYISVPRKNGKSTLAAGVALLLVCADGELGAEVYSAAADRLQASIVFKLAAEMARRSPQLQERLRIYARSMAYLKTASRYEVLSADHGTKDGLNASGIIFDELHAQKTRELWDVLTTSTSAREQPLVCAITTAGYDRKSICWEQYEYARKVSKGVIEDPSFYSYIREAGEEDDWKDPAVWEQSNPSYGVTIRRESFEEDALKAAESPAYQNTFRRLRLNQWTRQRSRYLDLSVWDRCADRVPLEELEDRQRPCFVGLDLATTTDVAAAAFVFPPLEDGGIFEVLARFWIPEESLEQRVRRDQVPYDAWAKDGLITVTEGNVIDFGVIREELIELADLFQIVEIAFDRWGSTAIVTDLQGVGFQMVQFGQGFASMSAPTKDLLTFLLGGRVRHGGNAVLRWMADNLVVRTDPAGNLKPDKEKSTEKVDGMVALIMALDRATRREGPTTSIYDERGLAFL